MCKVKLSILTHSILYRSRGNYADLRVNVAVDRRQLGLEKPVKGGSILNSLVVDGFEHPIRSEFVLISGHFMCADAKFGIEDKIIYKFVINERSIAQKTNI